MTRAKSGKLYRTFVKGLITEAGFLTYPEDASTDELNTVLSKKGNRSRRLGMDYEPSSTDFSLAGATTTTVTTEHLWRAPDNRSGINFLVIQAGRYIHFFDTATVPLSEGKKSFTIDLDDFLAPSATIGDAQTTHVSFSSGKGYLFIAQEFIDPISVEYHANSDTITPIAVHILMRDFDGVYDGLANDDEPTTLSNEHRYNLMNQGWIEPGTGGAGDFSEPSSDDGSGGTVSDGGTYDPYTGGFKPRTKAPVNP